MIPRLGATPLRQSTVYHTIHIVTNTMVMGKRESYQYHLYHPTNRHHPHHAGHLPQLPGGEGHVCSHSEAQQHCYC